MGMLVLDRDANETINIGADVEITVLRISSKKVRLGIKAPKDVPVLRNEIFRKGKEEKQGIQGGNHLKCGNRR